MDADELQRCLCLLMTADRMLLAHGEGVLAAQLSAVIEPLRQALGLVGNPEAVPALL
jgi:hypothetical protein